MSGFRNKLLYLIPVSFAIASVPARADLIGGVVNGNTTINPGFINGQANAGYTVLGGTFSASNTTFGNFITTGGAGSGGGAGLGGVIFVGQGATANLNNVTFLNNAAIGGTGGNGSKTGGVLNGLLTSTANGSNGTAGASAINGLFGDGNGNGLAGLNGSVGGNATHGFGGAGGAGGAGANGYVVNTPGILEVAVDTTLVTYYANQVSTLSEEAGQDAVDIVEDAADAVTAGVAAVDFFEAGAAAEEEEVAIEQGERDGFAEAKADESLAEASVTLGEQTAALTQATAELSSWNAAELRGVVGLGGNGGSGATGGQGSSGFGGGAGGNGAQGGVQGIGNTNDPLGSAPDGVAGSGGQGGTGGFGGGGGQGGDGGAARNDSRPNLAGSPGSGGQGGFGAGTGSTGAQTLSNGTVIGANNGGGGSGFGGVIFVQAGGTLNLTGNATFSGNTVAGGDSQNGGSTGQAVGTDLFMMTGSSVTLTPGAGNKQVFNGTIADDSAASISGSANAHVGAGAGLTINVGDVYFNGNNTYSGATVLNSGAVLHAVDSAGLPTTSNLTFNGGVFQSTGDFTRFLGTTGVHVRWLGSGGFAADGGALNVSLNGGQPLIWNNGNFVPTGSTLLFGSASANGVVTLINGINLAGGTRRIDVTASAAGAAQDVAVLSGVLSNGALIVNGSGALGTLILAGNNTYQGQTTLGGGLLVLGPAGSIASSSMLTDNGVFDISQTANGASIQTLAGNGIVFLGSQTLTFTNASTNFTGGFAGTGRVMGAGVSAQGVTTNTDTPAGGVTVAGGTQTLSGASDYQGLTTINSGAGLTLTGTGSIETSVKIVDNGVFDISGSANGARIVSLGGSGQVSLGQQTLTLTQAADSFAGTIAGTGGLVAMGGTETLTGSNTFTGSTGINTGATVALAGNGSIAASSGVVANGVFDISATANGASITTLSGTGSVNLGAQSLTLTNAWGQFDGSISGSGPLTVASGLEVLTGANLYTGQTTTNPNATLALVGTGSIASSAGIINNGSLDITETTSGAAITSLTGNGLVALGNQTLTLTNANDTYAGTITGIGGGLSVTGGTETLTGTNGYTGTTGIATGASLALAGSGSIGASSGVANNGVLDISQTTAGAAITTLNGSGSVALGNQTLTLTNANDSFAGTIAGAGGLTVAGGTELLAGTNTYTGATTVNPNAVLGLSGNGSVAASSGVQADGLFDISQASGAASITTLSGGGMVNLGANTLTLTAANSAFGGTIGGAGGLTLAGGSQTLSGTNIYTGATSVQPGATLALTGNGGIAMSSGVDNEGVFDISQTTAGTAITTLSGAGQVALGAQPLVLTNANDTFSGSIAGTGGQFAVMGGTETLTGSNTYTGGTVIGSGATLRVNGDAALGAGGPVTISGGRLTVLNDMALNRPVVLGGAATLDSAQHAVTVNGVISGPGGLVADGGGSIALTAANTYSGGTQVINKTTLKIASDSALGATSGPLVITSGVLSLSGALDTARPVDVGLDGQIQSNGNNVHLTGPVIIAARNQTPLFTGTANVTAGSWTVDSNVLTVAAEGKLTGVGTVAQTTVVKGTLSPGNSPGTLIFTAPVTMAPGSITNINIDGTGTGTGIGNYSRVIVTGAGNSFTADGTLQPLLRGITGSASNTFTPVIGEDFMVIAAQGGVGGGFIGVNQPAGLPAGTRFDAIYGPNTVDVVVTPAAYGNLALAGLPETPNQKAAGGAIDAFRPAAGRRVSDANADLLYPLYRLGATSIPQALDQLSPTVYGNDLLALRDLTYAFDDQISLQLSDRRQNTNAASTAPGPNGSTVWVSGFGQFDHVRSTSMPGYSASMGGAVAGIDTSVLGHARIGAVIGGASNQTSARNGASASDNVGEIAAYGDITFGRVFVDGQLGYVHSDQTTRRTLSAWDAATHSSDGINGVNSRVAVGTDFTRGRWGLEPFVALTATDLSAPLVHEHGLFGTTETIRSGSVDGVQSLAAMRVGTSFAITPTHAVDVHALVGWAHEFGDVQPRITAAFAQAPDAVFTTSTAPQGRDAARLGLSASVNLARNIAAYGSAQASLASGATSVGIDGGIRITW